MIDELKKIFQRTIDCKIPEWKKELQQQQEWFFFDCIKPNIGWSLHNDLGINSWMIDHTDVKSILSLIWLWDYARIKPYIDLQMLTVEKPLYIWRTSGTSDGNNGGKDIPITQLSLEYGEQKAIKNTLCSVLFEQWGGFLFKWKALVLSGAFDGKKWYISGIINCHSGYFGDLITYPPKTILAESNRSLKKKIILDDMRKNDILITSIHGVPTRPLELIHFIIQEDRELAKKIFSWITYISIGGGPPLQYKKYYADMFKSLWVTKEIAFTNNHNATEWFFASQQRNLLDTWFHWMVPHIRGNRFWCIEYSIIDFSQPLSKYVWNILFLHQVVPGVEYLLVVLNHRIPVPYIIKDRVIFNDQWEYMVTGRVGMASNIANEHIEQKHILTCLADLHADFPFLSDYMAIAGMELTSDHILIFHWIIESSSLWYIDHQALAGLIHQWFIDHHEQYAGFVARGKIRWCIVTSLPNGGIIEWLKKLGRRHEQSKIPTITDHNYQEIILPIRELIDKKNDI